MPKLGLSMTEGKLAEWRVSAGDQIEVGNTLFVVETEKVANEIDADSAGLVDAILVQAGETVPVGTPIARLLVSDTGKAPTEAKAPALPPSRPKAEAAKPANRQSPPTSGAPGARIIATPFARRLARERGIDLATVRGSGPRGRIKAADVEAQPSQLLQSAGRPDEAAGVFRFQLQLSSDALTLLQDELQPVLAHKIPLAAIVAVAAAAAFKARSDAAEQLAISVSVRAAGHLQRAALGGADCFRLRAIVNALAEPSNDEEALATISVEDPGLKTVVAFEPPLLAGQLLAIGVSSSDQISSLSIAIHRDFGFERSCEFIERLTCHLEHPLAMLASL